jgi:hypothetical protein
MFKWVEGLPDEHVAEVAAALDALPPVIPSIRRFHHGPVEGINAGNFDYAVVVDFRTAADYKIYRDHPRHREFVESFIVGKVTERAAVQYIAPD